MSEPRPVPAVAVRTVEAGRELLGVLKMNNPADAGRQLAAFLDGLLGDPPDPGVLYTLLEEARLPLSFIADELARRYLNKPLPLPAEEEAVFLSVTEAWAKMESAYALCARLETPQEGMPEYRSLVATLLHRCLFYTGMRIVEHYRIRRELPEGLWLTLHGYYATAEEWGVAVLPVDDVLESHLQATHCQAAYIAILLLEVAGPYSHGVRNLMLIRRWASMWAPLVLLEPLADDLVLPPYVVEFLKDAPLHPSSAIEGAMLDARQLDTTHLALQITHVIAQLRQRATPSQLGIGEETTGHVLQLLEQLLRPWSQAVAPRRFPRYQSAGVARLVTGFAEMFHAVTGKSFEQPDSAATYSRAEFDQLFTFRDRADPGQELVIRAQPAAAEEPWTVVNHSANGFRLARSASGARIHHGQLFAICPHDGTQFLLGFAIWLTQERSGGLLAGISTLPGLPTGVALRRLEADSKEHGGRYVAAFMLPALASIHEEASLVVPSGLYQAGHDLEVLVDDRPQRWRMNHILLRGADFDRISYIPL